MMHRHTHTCALSAPMSVSSIIYRLPLNCTSEQSNLLFLLPRQALNLSLICFISIKQEPIAIRRMDKWPVINYVIANAIQGNINLIDMVVFVLYAAALVTTTTAYRIFNRFDNLLLNFTFYFVNKIYF